MDSIWNKIPDSIKNIITIVLVILLIVVIIKVFKLVKQKIQDNQLDQYKEYPDQGNTSARDPRKLIDLIYEKLAGPNLYVYPEIVNLLTRLSDNELVIAYNYFEKEYGPATNMSLTEFIEDEWDGGNYEPAINKLKSNGLL